jgi:hypothetical protein
MPTGPSAMKETPKMEVEVKWNAFEFAARPIFSGA